MKDKCIEVELENEDHKIEITVFRNEMISDIKRTIMSLYEYVNINMFNTYLGNFHLHDYYDSMKIEELMTYFIIEKIRIKSNKSIQLHEEPNINTQNLVGELYKNYEAIIQLNEAQMNLMSKLKEMDRTEMNLNNYIKGLSKCSIFNKDSSINETEEYERIYQMKLNVYESKVKKLLQYKKLEKEGIKLGKKIFKLNSEKEELDKTCNYLSEKLNVYINQKKELLKNIENKEMKKDLHISMKKVIHLGIFLITEEDIEYQFNFQYKHDLLIKLLNENSVLVFHVNSDQLEIRQFKDTCNFSEVFLNQIKQDEFFLNFREKMLISINHSVFEYSYKTNTIVEIRKMQKDHKGGNFVYVPSINSIYCISGLVTPTCEVMKLDKKCNYCSNGEWEEISSLNKARGYYSTFVQNGSIVYVIFGFDVFSGEFLSTIEKYETSLNNAKWTLISLASKKSFNLIFAGVLPITDHEIYLIGGKDNQNNDNNSIISINLRRNTVDDTQMKIPLFEKNSIIPVEAKNLFYQETCFLGLNCPGKSFFIANFDTKNYIHLINLKTFEYTFYHRNELEIDKQNLVKINESSSEESSQSINN